MYAPERADTQIRPYKPPLRHFLVLTARQRICV
jgi:hypothetical protein